MSGGSPELEAEPVVLFDGDCRLCNGTVRWLIRRDRRLVLKFASLRSRAARDLLARTGVDEVGDLPDSIVFVRHGRVHLRSDAAIEIAKVLGLPWSCAPVGRLIPRVVRDALYDLVARNRVRWFGRQQACMMPSPELLSRFLDANERIGPGQIENLVPRGAPVE